ncbi:MAG: hypothetical protein HS111_29260 [Kofleriaceae bacterium]|nr:hypothetical protein [Kofleriaceae bacterium]
MQGGGACFNDFTCSSVANPNGFTGADLASAVAQGGTEGLFDRGDAANPLRDATFVFFPYCSGDVFAGSAESGYGGRVQVGYQNVGAYLDVIVPASTPVRRVIVSGSSAGGFGALYNYDRVATRYPGLPVFLIDDSGPPMADTWLTPCLQTQMRTHWNLNATLPTDCSACVGQDGGGLVNAMPFLADKHSQQRMALLSSVSDGVIRSFYGFGYHVLEHLADAGAGVLRRPGRSAHPCPRREGQLPRVLAGRRRPRLALQRLLDHHGRGPVDGRVARRDADGSAWDHAGP